MGPSSRRAFEFLRAPVHSCPSHRVLPPLLRLQNVGRDASHHADNVADTAKEKYNELQVGVAAASLLSPPAAALLLFF